MFQSEQVRWVFKIHFRLQGSDYLNPSGSWINFPETSLSFCDLLPAVPLTSQAAPPCCLCLSFPLLCGSQVYPLYHLPRPSFSCWGVKGQSVFLVFSFLLQVNFHSWVNSPFKPDVCFSTSSKRTKHTSLIIMMVDNVLLSSCGEVGALDNFKEHITTKWCHSITKKC